jgi:hypothetical protein
MEVMRVWIVLAVAIVGFALIRAVAYGFGDFVIFACRYPSTICFIFAFLFLSAGIAARVYRLSC